jgi:glycosyltransferase involved in cell wall biosynthesis
LQLHQRLNPAERSTGLVEAGAGANRAAYVVGIVSVAPLTEMSGQGRVLAQLVDAPGVGKGVIFSEGCTDASVADGTGVRLSPPTRSFTESIRKRAAEITVNATRAKCKVLIGCSGSPYDLTATAMAARYLNLPFVAYLFDDPILQWTDRRLRAAAARLHSIWLPLAKTVIVPNEFLAEDWRKRGAASVTVLRNAVADIKEASGRGFASPFASAVGSPIVYTGSVYHAQADAFGNLLSALEGADSEFHLHIFTSQAPSTVAGCGVRGPYVTRHDHLPAAQVPAILNAASVLFLPLGFETDIPEVIRTAAPAKLGDYLQSGRPILAHVPADSFVAHFCRQHDCAVVVDNPDIDALARAVRFLSGGGPEVERIIANARAASEQFSASAVRQTFWSTLDQIVAAQQTSNKLSKSRSATEPHAAGVSAAPIVPNDTNLPSGPLLLFVGALTPLQGPDLLIEAFAQIGGTFPDVSLLVIGPDRGMRSQLAAQARSLNVEGRVHFRASIEGDLRREAHRRALVIVVPSRSALLPSSAIEAGASGVPILTTEACNFGELAQVGGGLVVAANGTALAKGLSQMLGDRDGLRQMGVRLRTFVLGRYRWLVEDAEKAASVPTGVASPHLPQPAVQPPPPAVAINESLKRRLRRRTKLLLMRLPTFGRYISEKHVIAAERDQAVRDRDVYRVLLEAERAEKKALIAERKSLLGAHGLPQPNRAGRQVVLRSLSATIRKVLLVDFDIYSTLGGGQRFYRTVIERNPGAEFLYLSRGPDIEKKKAGALPENAVPIELRQTASLRPFAKFETVHHLSRWLENQSVYVAASVAGQHFDVVEVPSYVPVAGVIRHTFRLFGVTTDRMVVALLGWLSVGMQNAYDADDLQPMITEVVALEQSCLNAADLVYTISDMHRAENKPRHDREIEVIDMHDVLDSPIRDAKLVDPPERPDLWFVGRLDRNKGPDLFVDIAARVPRILYRNCFVSGPDGETAGGKWSDLLIRRGHEAGVDLKFEGALPDNEIAARVFDGGSVVIVPSRADSFNYVALEAIKLGTPIMLSEAAGAAEFLRVRHPELPVMTMRPDDINSAAETLTYFLQNYKNNALAFRRAASNLIWPRPKRNFQLQLYRRIVPTPQAAESSFPVAAVFPAPAVPTPYLGRDTSDPVLTIIVPTHQRPQWLVSCLASLSGARPRQTTVLVVDDGSPPEMEIPEIVAAYAPFARVVSIPNGGESNAINVGLAQATTPFAMMLGDDDVIEPSWPAEAIASLLAGDAVAVYPDWSIIGLDGQVIEEHRLVDCTNERLLSDHWCLPGLATVFRCRDALAIGGRNPAIRFVGDYDFYLRLAMRGRLRHVPRLGGYWRLHADNASMSKSWQLAAEHVSVIDAHLSERKGAGKRLPLRQARRARATAQMAAGTILALGGDEALSDAAFTKAWLLDRDVVRFPPPNLAAYPQSYPGWLKDQLAHSAS